MPTVRHLDLLPWCEDLAESDALFPLTVPISKFEATLLYWRAKRIAVREFFDGNVAVSAGGINLIDGELTVLPNVVDERHLVCGTNFVEHRFTFANSNADTSLEAFCNFFFQLFYNLDADDESNEYLLFAGGLVAAGDIHRVNFGTPTAAAFLLRFTTGLPNQAGDSVPYIASTLNLEGRIIEFSSNGASDILGPSITPLGDAETIAANIGSIVFSPPFANFEIVEYWPYDPEDGGGPIYDSATGEQLRSFPE